MTWVRNDTLGAWVWDAGSFVPGLGGTLPPPRDELLPADAGEVDYLLTRASWGNDPATLHYSDSDTYTYTYRSGGGFGHSGSRNAGYADDVLLVLFYDLDYDDPSTYFPSVDGSDLVGADLASGGTAPLPPPPPSNDDFATRLPLSGPCGSVMVDTAYGTTEPWESGIALGQTVWYEWVSPFDGWVFFRSELGEILTSFWTDPVVSGAPEFLTGPQVYGGEHATWAEVTTGQVLYLQVDGDYGGGAGTLRWQHLDDQPLQTISATTVFHSTNQVCYPNPYGWPQGFHSIGAGGEYGTYPNALESTDAYYVNFDGVPEGEEAEYLNYGLTWPSISDAWTADPASYYVPVIPDDAAISSIGWGAPGNIPSNGTAGYLRGTLVWNAGVDVAVGFSDSHGPFGTHPTPVTFGGYLADSSHCPTPAQVNAGEFQLALGVPFPFPGVSGEFEINQAMVTVQWSHDVGLPVPEWSCGIAPLRQLQRDDGILDGSVRQLTRNGPTSVQASIRQGPAGTYL